ncbi:MAG: sulfite oxidase heme-binding subunit YedZ [Anaerolineales bacterium]
MASAPSRRWRRAAIHAGALAPIAHAAWQYARGDFFVAPIAEMLTRTGRTGLYLLLITLACTPIHILTGWREAMRARRTVGLYTFFYVALHLLIFIGWDYGFAWGQIWRAIVSQPYVIVGFAAFLILLALALASTRRWQQRLGQRWRWLQRGVYLAATLDILHVLWLSKTPHRSIRYAVILGILLLIRLPPIRKNIVQLRQKLVQI